MELSTAVTPYLLDTTILSIYLDANHPHHAQKMAALNALPIQAPRYVSVVGLAELSFGIRLAETLGKADLQSLKEIIRRARNHALLDVTAHTSDAYAEIKAKMASKYLSKVLRKDRPKYLEDWVDKATGKALGIDENDLWMCAQAKERDIIFLTADGRMQRIPEADPDVKLLVI